MPLLSVSHRTPGYIFAEPGTLYSGQTEAYYTYLEQTYDRWHIAYEWLMLISAPQIRDSLVHIKRSFGMWSWNDDHTSIP